jgi:hypothetical protein
LTAQFVHQVVPALFDRVAGLLAERLVESVDQSCLAFPVTLASVRSEDVLVPSSAE